MRTIRYDTRSTAISVVVVTALAFVIGAALVTPFMPSARAATHNVNASFSAGFVPQTIPIAAGDTVIWHNLDAGLTHTITSDTSAWSELTLPGGGTVSHTFNSIGTFDYHCRPHSHMVGTVDVQAVIPEFPNFAVVLAGLLVMFLGLALARGRSRA